MDSFNDLICKNCHAAVLRDHPDYKMGYLWLKCNLCGYCEKKDEEKMRKTKERQEVSK